MARTKVQPHLPDETFAPPPGIPEIEEAALDYAALRDERMAKLTEEKDAKKRLVGILEFHAVGEYHNNGIDVTFEVGEKKIKVKVGG